MASAGAIAAAVDVPVSADLENGFGDEPEDAAETIRQALAAGLSGGSIEDYSMRPDDPIYPIEQAAERVAAAAVEVAHGGPVHFVLTARAENHIRGRDDLADTIRRLQALPGGGRRRALRARADGPRRDRVAGPRRRPPGERHRAARRAHRRRAGRGRRRPDLRRGFVRLGGAGRRGRGRPRSCATRGRWGSSSRPGRAACSPGEPSAADAARRSGGDGRRRGGLLDAALGHAVGRCSTRGWSPPRRGCGR